MEAKERRNLLLEKLKKADGPITGTALAKELGVSRQVVVGDFALLRASGIEVYATPQGYVLPVKELRQVIKSTLALRHGKEDLEEELGIIIDNGGKVLDVIVEHPVYGEIRANLMLTSRRDLADFIKKVTDSEATPLLSITGGVHLHTIEANDRQALGRIKEELKLKGFLYEQNS